ncbi:MAG TPA: cytochrome C [Candidatus Desulfobacillus sp.]|nr:cytochrome C [Candidatus Desulfobacillus sp.]
MKHHKIVLAVSLLGLASAAYADDSTLSRNMASACASCHGTNGNSVGGMDPLAGMPKEEMIRKFKDFRSGAKPATVMHQLAKGYTDQQVEMIANFFAAQK